MSNYLVFYYTYGSCIVLPLLRLQVEISDIRIFFNSLSLAKNREGKVRANSEHVNNFKGCILTPVRHLLGFKNSDIRLYSYKKRTKMRRRKFFWELTSAIGSEVR